MKLDSKTNPTICHLLSIYHPIGIYPTQPNIHFHQKLLPKTIHLMTIDSKSSRPILSSSRRLNPLPVILFWSCSMESKVGSKESLHSWIYSHKGTRKRRTKIKIKIKIKIETGIEIEILLIIRRKII